MIDSTNGPLFSYADIAQLRAFAYSEISRGETTSGRRLLLLLDTYEQQGDVLQLRQWHQSLIEAAKTASVELQVTAEQTAMLTSEISGTLDGLDELLFSLARGSTPRGPVKAAQAEAAQEAATAFRGALGEVYKRLVDLSARLEEHQATAAVCEEHQEKPKEPKAP